MPYSYDADTRTFRRNTMYHYDRNSSSVTWRALEPVPAREEFSPEVPESTRRFFGLLEAEERALGSTILGSLGRAASRPIMRPRSVRIDSAMITDEAEAALEWERRAALGLGYSCVKK